MEVCGVPVQTWDAIGSIATGTGVLAAGVAASVAARQLWYTKQARIDQNRPYVIVTFEQGETWFNHVDIMVRNTGAGPARNVVIKADPPLQRAREIENMPLAGARFFNEKVPMMPPGYELRTYFDTMNERQGTELPERYTFTVSYDDGHGHSWTETTVADLGLLNDLLFTESYNIHHLAKAVREIEQHIRKSPLAKGMVDATVETRAERTQRRHREHQEREEMLRRFEERQRSQRQATGDTPGSGQSTEECPSESANAASNAEDGAPAPPAGDAPAEPAP